MPVGDDRLQTSTVGGGDIFAYPILPLADAGGVHRDNDCRLTVAICAIVKKLPGSTR